MRTRTEVLHRLLDEMEQYLATTHALPLFLLMWTLRGEVPPLTTEQMQDLAQEAFDLFRADHPSHVVWSRWPIDLTATWPLEPGTPLDFDLDPYGPTDTPLQLLVPDEP